MDSICNSCNVCTTNTLINDSCDLYHACHKTEPSDSVVLGVSIEYLDKEIHENLDDKFGQICAILCSFPRDNGKDRGGPYSGREYVDFGFSKRSRGLFLFLD